MAVYSNAFIACFIFKSCLLPIYSYDSEKICAMMILLKFKLNKGLCMLKKQYRVGQHIKVRVTGIQPYGAFVETPDNTEGLIHISEVMDDYVHNLKKLLSQGQTVKAKIISIDESGKLNLSLKDNDYFKNYERKKEKRSVLDEIKETETYGFQTLKERLPYWVKQSKRRMQDEAE